jgi:hypothetical protein
VQLTDRVLRRTVAAAGDATLERAFGSPLAQRVMFGTMARRFSPEAAKGFAGVPCYELTQPATRRPPIRWTVEIADGRARARPGETPASKLALRFELADFLRIAVGSLDPIVPVLQSRASVRGDFRLALRLPAMFGAAPGR